MTQSNMYAELDIRIFKREEQGYPAKSSLCDGRQTWDGYRKEDISLDVHLLIG